MGYILLEGGAEFGGKMDLPDLRALALAGGPGVRLSIIPTAAAPDNNDQQAGQNGVRWFKHLGATRVTALPVIDRASANDKEIAAELGVSQLIYMLGGFPDHLVQTLMDSLSWQAILKTYRKGGVVGGSSAGAMALCEYYYNPTEETVEKALNLIPGTCLLPHHNTFGRTWATQLSHALPEILLIGIDEETGMIDDGPQSQWQIYGKGAVTLYRRGERKCYLAGETFEIGSLN
jgi:cyanophycinase